MCRPPGKLERCSCTRSRLTLVIFNVASRLKANYLCRIVLRHCCVTHSYILWQGCWPVMARVCVCVCCRPACRCSSCMATLVPHHSPDLHHSLPTSNRLPCTPLNVYHVTNQSIFLVFFVTVHVHECLVPVPCLYPPLYRPSERVLRLNYSFLCQWWEGGAGRIFQGSEAPLKAGK